MPIRNRFLAAGATLAGITIVAVPAFAGLGVAGEAPGDRAQGRPVAVPADEPGLVEAAYWNRVGRYVKAVELNAFYEAMAQQLAAEAAARRARSGGGGHNPDCLGSIKDRESGGNYEAVSSSGTYRGAYQFDQRTWDSNAEASGRTDLVGVDPATVDPASQDQIATDTFGRRGSQPWGGC
jgi:hypothetical protein